MGNVKDRSDFKDYRQKCPECGERMELKHSWGGDFEGRFMMEIHQCPKCKNIEVFNT